MTEFKYLVTLLLKQGSLEHEVRERVVKGRQVLGVLERGGGMSMEFKKGIRSSIILSTLL